MLFPSPPLARKLVVLFFPGILLLASGCARPASETPDPSRSPVAGQVQPPSEERRGEQPAVAAQAPPQARDDDNQDRYDEALSTGLTLLADRKYAEALAALETAQTFEDNDFVRGEIAKLKLRLNQRAASRQTLASIEALLGDGRAAEAGKLATDALREFGASDDADKLMAVKLQADALQTVQQKETEQARFRRLTAEGDDALRDKNLRAASLAFEQALLLRDDDDLQRKLEGVHESLDRYDSLRKKAAELRRDPTRLDEALEALQEAAKAWNTLQVRQELDDAMLALQKRRDTVSVVEFETRGDIGIAEAGRTLAEELLPMLKPRFDLVERGQIQRILDEIKLSADALVDPQQQREVARLAKVRYLVLGSVTRLAGVSLHARLVDARTGLVVQTGKIFAPTPEALLPLVPELAKQLLMSDEEKMAYDQQQLALAQKPPVLDVDAPLPPPPPPPAEMPPFQQVAAFAPVPPPAFGGLKADVFVNLQPAPAQLPPPPPPPPANLQQRFLAVAIDRGDFYFRAGRYRDAQRYFDFALNLNPGNPDLLLRLERVRPCLPPPVPVVVVPQPVIIAPRPRVAMMNFLVVGDPRVVPPVLSTWTPQHLVPYLAPQLEFVDPNEVYWMMGRMGMTMSDLMNDPQARRWLGRAVGVRYFLVGTVTQTASFNVNTYLLEAEHGYLQGSGLVHARNPYELKLLLGDLAAQTLMDPAQRAAQSGQVAQFDLLVRKGQQCMARNDFALAIGFFNDALQLRPSAVDVRVQLQSCRQKQSFVEFQVQRQQNVLVDPSAIAAAQRRQWELAQAAEAARLQAAQAPLDLQVAAQAQQLLFSQAQVAIKTKRFGLSVGFFEGGLNLAPAPAVGVPAAPLLAPPDDAFAQFAQARAGRERIQEQQATTLLAQREALLRQQREQELKQAQKRIAEEQQRRLQDLEAQRQARDQRDARAAQLARDQAQQMLADKNYDGAIAALTTARQLRNDPLTNQLFDRAVELKAMAKAKSDAERAQLEKNLAAERERRMQAEAEAQLNQERYKNALAAAQQALAQKDLGVAEAKFNEAGKLYKTDIVLTGLQKVEEARTQENAEQLKAARLQKLVADGQAALQQRDYSGAAKNYRQARLLAPERPEVLAGLARAELAQQKQAAEAQKQAAEADRQQQVSRLMQSAADHLAKQQPEAAVANLRAAEKLAPEDPAVRKALQNAQAAVESSAADARARAEAKQRTETYLKAMSAGKLALSAKNYDDAIRAFGEAQKTLPGDGAAQAQLEQAQQGKAALQQALKLAAQKKAAEAQRVADLQNLLAQARTAQAAGNLAAADQALDQAEQLAPKSAEVSKARQELTQAQKAQAATARAVRLSSLLGSVPTHLKVGQFDEAQRALNEVAKLEPAHAQLVPLQRQINQARQAAGQAAKAQAEFSQSVALGQKALQARDYASALREAQEALKIRPNDPEAQQLAAQAQQGLQAGAKAQAEFNQSVAQAQKSLQARDFATALREAQEALKIRPNDPQAQQLAAQAQQGVQAAAKAQAEFDQSLAQAQKSLQARDFATALREAQEALKIRPNHPEAQQLAAQAQQGLQSAAKAQAEFSQSLTQAQKALQAGDHATALREAQEALKVRPNDPQAQQLAAQAQQGLQAAAKAQAEFNQSVAQAQKSLLAKDFATALREAQEALKVRPNDPQAQQLAALAQQALNQQKAPKVNPEPGPNPQAQAQKFLQLAQSYEKQAKFRDALNAYQEALRLAPNDPQAHKGVRQAQLQVHITDAQYLLEKNRAKDAIRELEAAAQLAPNHPTVQQLLQRARNPGKKGP